MSAAVVVEDLAFTYPGEHHPVFDGLDITIEAGERVALLGPNGSGKTTLALHLNGLLRAQRGEIVASNLVLGDDTLAEIRRRVGLVFQDPNDQLFMHRVRDDVAFGPANLGLDDVEIARRVEQALDDVGAAGFETLRGFLVEQAEELRELRHRYEGDGGILGIANAPANALASDARALVPTSR